MGIWDIYILHLPLHGYSIKVRIIDSYCQIRVSDTGCHILKLDSGPWILVDGLHLLESLKTVSSLLKHSCIVWVGVVYWEDGVHGSGDSALGCVFERQQQVNLKWCSCLGTWHANFFFSDCWLELKYLLQWVSLDCYGR